MSSPPPARETSARKQRGAYYTPAAIARHILHRTLDPLWAEGTRPRVLDPACGDGVFLVEAANLLAAANDVDPHADGSIAIEQRLDLIQQCLFGVDIDRQAVADARERLAAWILGSGNTSPQRQRVNGKRLPSLEHNIICGNSLLVANESQALGVRSPAPPVDLSTFDAIVGNPPYINIRVASHTLDASLRDYYAARYQSARGAYDQYVLFLERGCELLRAGGRYGWIVPNKLAGAGYAEECRALLARQTTLEHWEDLSAVRVFAEAGVYPQIIVGSNRRPSARGRIVLSRWTASGQPAAPVRAAVSEPLTIAASSLSRQGWTFGTALEVEGRVETVPLGELARLHSGATGFQAQQLAAELREPESLDGEPDAFRFITSGNIDRFRIEDRHVRFMKRRFQRACLPRDCGLLTDNKRRLYAAAKIVIAGMTRRLEAAFDQEGRALGVQVYAAIDFPCDPYYLLGLLNSRLLSHLFRQRFAAKQLSGGYLAINKGQLVQLPIVKPSAGTVPQRIAAIARQLEQLPRVATQASRHEARLEAELDRSVYQLYRLAEGEIAAIELAFAKAA